MIIVINCVDLSICYVMEEEAVILLIVFSLYFIL